MFKTMTKHRYFHFDEASGTYQEMLAPGPSRFVRVFAIVAGLFVLVSVFL